MKYFFLLMTVLNLSCGSTSDDIFVEKIPNHLLNDKNRFDLDNTIYTLGREFIYEFSLKKDGESLFSEIEKIKLKVLGTTEPFSKFNPDYSQTVVQYSYIDINGRLLSKEKTGIIENSKNLWIHPPRTLDAGILQLSAFPYIKFGNSQTWRWNLEASYQEYQDLNLRNEYQKKESVAFSSEKLGEIKCIEIIGQTKSEVGLTNSKFLFSRTHGFVFLQFENIDGTEITLKLIE